jgi:hypothetical protein
MHRFNQGLAGRSRGTSLDEDAVAPVFVLRDLAAESGNASLPNRQNAGSQIDIINAGLISQDNAIFLISM